MSSKKRKMDEERPADMAGVPAVAEEEKAAQSPAQLDASMDAEEDSTATAAEEKPSMSDEAIEALASDLPTVLRVLQQLNGDLPAARLPRFKALRKEVLRMAAQLQGERFQGETKDAAQKRQHRRREKEERLAAERRRKAAEKKYINSVALRNSRIQALNALMEPEAWGQGQGNKLLLPGEEPRLLMSAEATGEAEPESSPQSAASLPSPSPTALKSSVAPTAEARAKAQGPQSFTYPTVLPDSALAREVGAGTASAPITKSFVRNKQSGASGTVLPTPSAAPEEGASSVLVPPIPPADQPQFPTEEQVKKQLEEKGGVLTTTQKQTSLTTSQPVNPSTLPRQQKKAMFGQEGVHVNAAALQAAREKEERERKEKEEKEKAKAAAAAQESTPMDTSSSSSAQPSSSIPAPVSEAAARSDPAASGIKPEQEEFGPELSNPRSCYCCKARFWRLHFFYSEFCAPCARLNYAKRQQMADLRGKVVLLTGSRVKIGFRCGLRLLRCGATLIATSRFPHDTARRYAAEHDFQEWKDRLHIYGLDLRDLKSVVRLSDILSQRYDRLDAIVNNAAQTIRRPPQYYRHLLPIECAQPEELDPKLREVLKGDMHELAGRRGGPGRLKAEAARMGANLAEVMAAAAASNKGVTVEDISHMVTEISATDDKEPVAEEIEAGKPKEEQPAESSAASSDATSTAAPADASPPTVLDAFHRNDDLNAALLTTTNRAAALSQLAVLPGDSHTDDALFPANKFDVTGQQLDLRPVNSWNLTLEQVDPSELVEVFAINALAPFILNSRLKGLMLRGGAHPQFGPDVQITDKYIVNVSAMEGKFYRHKSAFHPHTNMAKAALNMMTRTAAQSYAQSRIYMTAVDTGWINDENPHDTAQKIFEKGFQCPIDEEDAMARILDPILSGVNTGVNCFGKFFKDYHETEW